MFNIWVKILYLKNSTDTRRGVFAIVCPGKSKNNVCHWRGSIPLQVSSREYHTSTLDHWAWKIYITDGRFTVSALILFATRLGMTNLDDLFLTNLHLGLLLHFLKLIKSFWKYKHQKKQRYTYCLMLVHLKKPQRKQTTKIPIQSFI